ncbi:MAG: hypothetical protein AUK53_02130 [Betaproteobacteria bacterium CG2_30_59_46]|nr:MAG: hypothetical protein AUK53_02130 [Betaproteobacteria bacterium CG2_30_59_46]PIQ12628.1 MAG: TIGR00341 family protein [Hydrogenophilales bacterium CG18_big_fil_WC_8_21_14_2_50_58_12]PIY01456.1 MAG: hypothetical protein COZ23_03065 [Hydrogenophilales bacterium CG_4_10_14_3_um_filter_58_23]PJB08480.1 MAG: hypothetical protein CO125_01695 [Hydrogenophilales bacterium CG_4_9_14_3_um_filter_59_35]
MTREHLFLRELRKLFDLRGDMDEPGDIEASIRQGVKTRGTNLWILMFAILVASIGLNVNSTAVIIGAMLISPLMGPIMGIGYGAGVDDFHLIRQSVRSLGVFVFLSLLTSTLYFLFTPLTQAQSELLARTAPNLWDVLIALFGGMAGIIAVTRREKSNVIPGVAIATALMPPLCTAGYGIATGQPTFFLGAFYLFTINAVYIALSALLLTKLLRLPRHSFPSAASQKQARLIITAAIMLTIVPSVYLAFQLVQHEVFKTEVNRYLETMRRTEKNLFILEKTINPVSREITLTVAGKALDKGTLERLNTQLDQHQLGSAKLTVHALQQDDRMDLSLIKTEMQQDLYRNSLHFLEAKNTRIQQLEDTIRNQQNEQRKQTERLNEFDQVREELHAQYPDLKNVIISHGKSTPSSNAASSAATSDDTLIVYLEARKLISGTIKARIRNWLKTRFKLENVYVVSKPI